MTDDRSLNELFSKLTRIAIASSNGGGAQQTIWFKLDGKSYQGKCAQKVPKGNCLALLTDDREYWLARIGQEIPPQSQKRVLQYKRSLPNRKTPKTLLAASSWLVKASQTIQFMKLGNSQVNANGGFYLPVFPNPALGTNLIEFTSPDRKSFIQYLGLSGVEPSFIQGTYTRNLTITDTQINFHEIIDLTRYYDNNSPDGVIIIYADGKPVEFNTPTDASIEISINLTPGSDVINTGVGISVNRVVEYDEDGLLFLLNIASCDVYNSGTSANYSINVPPGTHFVSLGAFYNHNSPGIGEPIDTALAFEVQITITGETKNRFYFQNEQEIQEITSLENLALKLGDISVDLFNSGFDLYQYYLTNTSDNIYFHIKAKETYLDFTSGAINTEKLYRYIFQKLDGSITSSIYIKPSIIPPLDDDWQNEWVSSYFPEVDSINSCYNEFKLNLFFRYGKDVNFIETSRFYLSRFQNIEINGETEILINWLLTPGQNFIALGQDSDYDGSDATCSLSENDDAEIELYSTPLIEDYPSDSIVLLDFSAIELS